MPLKRRLFLGMVACLPLAWQVKLRAASPAPSGWCWWHTTFDGRGGLREFLRVRYNIASRGGLGACPREVILGASAYDQYLSEIEPLRKLMEWTQQPAGAAPIPFKSSVVYSLSHSPGWSAWHVGFLVTHNGARKLAAAQEEGRI